MTKHLTITVQLLSPKIPFSAIINWQTLFYPLESSSHTPPFGQVPSALGAYKFVLYVYSKIAILQCSLAIHAYICLYERPETPQVSSVEWHIMEAS